MAQWVGWARISYIPITSRRMLAGMLAFQCSYESRVHRGSAGAKDSALLVLTPRLATKGTGYLLSIRLSVLLHTQYNTFAWFQIHVSR